MEKEKIVTEKEMKELLELFEKNDFDNENDENCDEDIGVVLKRIENRQEKIENFLETILETFKNSTLIVIERKN
jgi:hypothetical protein